MRTLHEWACTFCGYKRWAAKRPPKPSLIMRVLVCDKCKRPMRPTGQTKQVPDLRSQRNGYLRTALPRDLDAKLYSVFKRMQPTKNISEKSSAVG